MKHITNADLRCNKYQHMNYDVNEMPSFIAFNEIKYRAGKGNKVRKWGKIKKGGEKKGWEGWVDGWANGWMDIPIADGLDIQMEKWINGWMKGRKEEERIPCTELKRIKLSQRSVWSFLRDYIMFASSNDLTTNFQLKRNGLNQIPLFSFNIKSIYSSMYSWSVDYIQNFPIRLLLKMFSFRQVWVLLSPVVSKVI